jgi:IgA peptidase M64
MKKKSQIQSTPIIYVLIVVIIGFFLVLAINFFNSLGQKDKQLQLDSFAITLQNTIKNQVKKPSYSVNPITLSIPSDVDTVCFVQDNEQYSPHSFSKLTKTKEIYQDRNLFFFPNEKFSPLILNNFELNDGENPLCVNTKSNKLNLRLTSLKDTVLLETQNNEDKHEKCIIVPGSNVGDPLQKIDLVFLGYGYNDKEKFGDDVNSYVNNYFFTIDPFKNNKDKFNVWMIDNSEPECSVDSYVFCDSLSVNKIATNCPNDFVVILVDESELSYSVRSSAISNMVKINTKDNSLVLLHEFGHVFGKLADEYTDSYYDSWFNAKDYPNCDKESCSSWSRVDGTDCIKGCSTNKYYRSIKTSIMRNYDKSSSYGLLNEKILNENLERYE